MRRRCAALPEKEGCWIIIPMAKQKIEQIDLTQGVFIGFHFSFNWRE